MKLLKMIFDNTGKWGLSAAQTAGVLAATTVGVIGVGMMMTGPSDVNPDTAFSSSDDVVYVSSTASGVYDGVGYADDRYGDGGEVRSSINVKQSRDWQLMEQDAMKEPEKQQQDAEESATSDLEAFKMDGAKTGLNMGEKGLVDTGNPGKGDMTAFQQQIANMQAMAEQKQKEAEMAAAAAGQGNGQGGAAGQGVEGTNPQGGKFDLSGSINTSGGNGFGAEGLRPTGVKGPEEGENPKEVGTPEANTIDPRKPRFTWSREMEIEAGKKYKFGDGKELENIYNATKTNAGNVVGDYMLAASENKVGPTAGKYVNTGNNNSSSDFIDDGGLENMVNARTATATAYSEAKDKLVTALDNLMTDLNDGWNTWLWLRYIPLVDLVGAIFHGIRNGKRMKKFKNELKAFKEKWVDDDTRDPSMRSNAGKFATAAETMADNMKDKTWGKLWVNPDVDVYVDLDDKWVTVTAPKGKNRIKNLYKKMKEVVWPKRAKEDEKK